MTTPLPTNETKRIEALRRYNILDTQPEKTFDDFTFLASTICQAPIALLTFVDESRQWFKAHSGIKVTETPREGGFCSHTILGTDVMIVEDASSDERFAQHPFVTEVPNIRFYAGAPLIDAEGYALGSLCVIDEKPRSLSPENRLALEALARQIISQLELRRTSADLAEALADIKILREILPICSHCREIRDDSGYWQSVESYVMAHSDTNFSHGICPACLKANYPTIYENLRAAGKA